MRPPSKRSFSRKKAPTIDLSSATGPRKRSSAAETVQLTSLIDIMTTLLVFLLSVVALTQVSLISLPLPKVAQSEDEIQKVEKEKFILKLYVIDDKTKNQVRPAKGYVVDCSCLKEPKFLPLTSDGKYDRKGLNEIMLSIKKKNEDQKMLILIPGHYVTFEEMVFALDATRETLPSLVPNTQQPPYELFPDVMLEEVGS